MMPKREVQPRILLVVAIAAAVLIQVSIAASQILLGLGVLLTLLFERKLLFPRIWIPLACLVLWTALADVVSPDPWLGRAQIKKFFVFLFIPLVYGVFREQFPKVFWLLIGWTAAATASGLLAVFQFVRSAHASYVSYVGKRITGFESHWMTFGALQLSVLLLILAEWFFSSRRMPGWATYASLAILAAAILLGGTRSIWLAALPAALYLVWAWRPRMMFAVPVAVGLAFAVAPHNVKERLLSLVHPKEDVDSNSHRVVTFRTGLEMIKAHPWLGLGPEEINRNFSAYVPKDIRRPLPVGYYGHLHNIYLQYAAERGIPGLLCVLWFIGLAVYDSVRAIVAVQSTHSQELCILHGTIAVTIAVLIGGIFEYNLGDSEVLMMFVSVVGLAYAAMDNLRERLAAAQF